MRPPVSLNRRESEGLDADGGWLPRKPCGKGIQPGCTRTDENRYIAVM